MSPNTKPTAPLGIYVRVSQVAGREGDSFISPGLQEERCRAQLAALGFDVGEVYVDLDQSGGKDSRPAFDRMKADIADGTIGGVAVYKLSRFGRRVTQVLRDVAWIENHGAAFISVDPPVDTSTAMGRFLLTVFTALDELELERVTSYWGDTQQNAVDAGIHLSAHLPAGYDRGADRRLVPNAHAPSIREAFELRADGASYGKVAQFLTEAGVPTSKGNKSWNVAGTAKLLANPVYTGQARGGVAAAKDNAHPAIVDLGLFARVKARKTENGSYGLVNPKRPKELLSGLVYCAGCLNKLTPNIARRGEKTYRYWICPSGAKCKAKAGIGIDILEHHVIDHLVEHASLAVAKPRSADHLVAQAEIRFDNAQAALDQFDATWTGLGLSPERAAAMAATLERERDEAAQAVNDLHSVDVDNGGLGFTFAEIRDSVITYFGSIQGDAERAAIETWVEGVEESLAETEDGELLLQGETLRAAILAYLASDRPRARKLVGQLIERVTVEKGRKPVAERVTITLK